MSTSTPPVVVHGKPGCQPCRMTVKFLETNDIEYTYIDITADLEAYERVAALGHRAAPVVVTADDNWSGYQPDRLAALAGVN